MGKGGGGGGILPTATLNLNSCFVILRKHPKNSELFQKFICEKKLMWSISVD